MCSLNRPTKIPNRGTDCKKPEYVFHIQQACAAGEKVHQRRNIEKRENDAIAQPDTAGQVLPQK